MSQNFISLSITDEQLASALAGLEQLEAALPGLLALPETDRRNLFYMGPKSEAFCRRTLQVMQENAQIVPPSLDLAGAAQDLAALDRLRPLLERAQALTARMSDSVDLLGSDAMDVALDGYAQLKLSGGDFGLDDLRRQLGRRFRRGKRDDGGVPAPVPGPTPDPLPGT